MNQFKVLVYHGDPSDPVDFDETEIVTAQVAIQFINDYDDGEAAQPLRGSDGTPAEYEYCECPSCHATGLPELFMRRRTR